ncbi:MAG: TrkH family potassium uptake protein [Kineosporiaceae bacterium]
MPSTGGRLRGLVASPVRLVPIGFLGLVAIGTGLLLLPVSAGAGAPAAGVPFTTAAFTATSAVCVTGLIVVDTPTYWSTTGQAIILVLIQVGGLGVATLSALLGLVIARRLRLSTRLVAAEASGALALGTVRSLIVNIVRIFLVVETVVAALLATRFALHYDEELPRALWLGAFHSVSAFNNAGFALFTDNLMPFATDEWITVPIMVALGLGGIGFPVIFELVRRTRPRDWSINTRLVLTTSAVLLVAGTALVWLSEWRNAATVAGASGTDRFFLSLFLSASPRTAGFNVVDYGDMTDAGLLVTITLMFVGGGSASTAGGIKVATLAVLVMAVVAEARGDTDTTAFDRRIDTTTLRQALAVTALTMGLVVTATLLFLELTDERLADALFEVVSATATVGLTTGVTFRIDEGPQWILIVCMFLGRIGPTTLAAALALRSRRKLYRLPPGRPLIG